MVLGIFFLNKKYSIREYASIFLITAGICICTLASSKVTSSSSQDEDGELVDFIWWIVGKIYFIENRSFSDFLIKLMI
jgi:drug/metabolite transporter (DMT)-like permease